MAIYQETKPLATDKLSTSQGELQQNFEAIKDLIDENHETFNNGASPEGKHKKVDVTNIALPAIEPVAAGTDLTMYNYLNALTAQGEMYVRRNGADGVPFTANKVEIGAATLDGWSYLPSGLLMKWGTTTTTVTISLAAIAGVAPAFTSGPYVAFATPKDATHGAVGASITGVPAAANLTLCSEIDHVEVYWVVIGK